MKGRIFFEYVDEIVMAKNKTNVYQHTLKIIPSLMS